MSPLGKGLIDIYVQYSLQNLMKTRHWIHGGAKMSFTVYGGVIKFWGPHENGVPKYKIGTQVPIFPRKWGPGIPNLGSPHFCMTAVESKDWYKPGRERSVDNTKCPLSNFLLPHLMHILHGDTFVPP